MSSCHISSKHCIALTGSNNWKSLHICTVGMCFLLMDFHVCSSMPACSPVLIATKLYLLPLDQELLRKLSCNTWQRCSTDCSWRGWEPSEGMCQCLIMNWTVFIAPINVIPCLLNLWSFLHCFKTTVSLASFIACDEGVLIEVRVKRVRMKVKWGTAL